MARFIDLLIQTFVVLIVLPIGIPWALWHGSLVFDHRDDEVTEQPLWYQLQYEEVLNQQLMSRRAILAGIEMAEEEQSGNLANN